MAALFFSALSAALIVHPHGLPSHHPVRILSITALRPDCPADTHRIARLRAGAVCCAETSRGGLRILEWIPSQQLLVGTARYVWNRLWYVMLSELAPQSPEGAYVRPAPQLGSSAVTGWPEALPAVSGRYHVYLGNACPWCHRVGATLALRGLSGVVGVTRMADDPERASRGGWAFDASDPDPLCGAADLRQVYDKCTKGGSYRGRCTAPLLLDLQAGSIISNESGDIVRMLNGLDVGESGEAASGEGGGAASAESFEARSIDLFPVALRSEIDATCGWVYDQINNGVYRAGFCTSQHAYEEAEAAVHAGLQRADGLLASRRFLCGATLTEADVRLLPTAVRFDGVYASLFRCGRKQIRSDYPHVQRWMREVLQMTGSGWFDLEAARRSYCA
jgi:putative glutathione S-transferase